MKYIKHVTTLFGNINKTSEYEAKKGLYQIECWGASGAGSSPGGYVSGFVYFREFTPLHIYIGEMGKTHPTQAAFNGGGFSQGGGGGASDVRLRGGHWNDLQSLISRIIVAGAGGGGDGIGTGQGIYDSGGAAGGLVGFSSSLDSGKGGTQETGGKGFVVGAFGQDGGNMITDDNGHGAGGGGYFGGGSSTKTNLYGGGGGSSFISGHPQCVAVDPTSTDIRNMKKLNTNVHHTGVKFFNTTMYDGKSPMPSPDKDGNENGHIGDGAVRITYFQEKSISCIIDRNSLHLLLYLSIPIISFS